MVAEEPYKVHLKLGSVCVVHFRPGKSEKPGKCGISCDTLGLQHMRSITALNALKASACLADSGCRRQAASRQRSWQLRAGHCIPHLQFSDSDTQTLLKPGWSVLFLFPGCILLGSASIWFSCHAIHAVIITSPQQDLLSQPAHTVSIRMPSFQSSSSHAD